MDFSGFICLILLLAVSLDARRERRRRKNDCNDRSCFPISGNLLVGREANLTTDSTCGLYAEETYCNLINVNRFERDLGSLKEMRSECFTCDSRNPGSKNSHRIENIVSFFKKNKKDRWWQAESDKHQVYIQLDLEAEFHVTHVIMTFRTFRPAAMLIERSYDFGKTWKVYRYFAQKCSHSWPRVKLEWQVQSPDEAYCEPLENPGIPSTGAELVMKVLNPNKQLRDPYSKQIQNLIKITNLRVNFTQLFTLGDNLLGSRKQSYYYALYNMVVSGFCSCYGHADQCIPLNGQSARGMVYGKCKCNHYTTGHNCERCLPFYQDLPWRPAHGEEKNECQQCNCSNHSHKCHFDPALFEATQQRSGGVCEDCEDNTMGQHCEHCAPNYYRNPNVPHNHPQTCLQCDCDPRGSENLGECDSFTEQSSGMVAGHCSCKRLVTGHRCDTCLPGHFDLDYNNPDGCRACSCSQAGTVEGFECETGSGDCKCKRFVTGRTCDVCMQGYWGLGTDAQGCKACNCDVGGSVDSQCDLFTGQCRCRPHITGRYCNQVQQGYYYPLLDWLLYEAELARPVGEVELENREVRDDGWWTGSGYMRVHERASLEFSVDNIPHSMHYDLLVRYEAKMPQRWEDVRVQVERVGGRSRGGGACHNHIPADDHKSFSIDPYAKHVLVSPPSCFERGMSYKITLTFPDYHSREDLYLSIDSLVLLPASTGHPIFQQHQEVKSLFERYNCRDLFLTPQGHKPHHSKECKALVFSSSVAINNGAKSCDCHPTGSENAQCAVRGGQCSCRPNVIGRRCDKCAPLHYGLSRQGCVACACHVEGSLGRECDQRTGKCPCKPHAHGQQCGNCQRGFWDFPQCRRCQCNGRARECDNLTGRCLRCSDNSGGDQCERCGDGYYGDLRLGCRRCPCPSADVSHAQSCQMAANQVICQCRHGYTGERCDECMKGFYGSPTQRGGRCEACQCHGNIDPAVPGSCDPGTGECRNCLHNTEGRQCERCMRGYYGDALRQNCIPCSCNRLGTRDDLLQSCDPSTGTCHCLPNVIGQQCDKCQPNHWKLATGRGCEACACNLVGSQSAQCDQFSGQCRCRAGRGGRDCSECSNLHWGNPNVQCQRCRCNPEGSLTQQCDKRTGACRCKKGVSGRLCSRCARGAMGSLPNCVPCGPCYDLWEQAINEMKGDLDEVVRMSRGVDTSGPGHSFLMEFHRMELRLEEVRRLVEMGGSSSGGSPNVDRLFRSMHELRMNISQYDRQLGNLEHQERNTSAQIYGLSDRINNINHRVQLLERLVFELKLNATGIQEKDVSGAYDSIKESQKRSNQVAHHVNDLTHNRFKSQQTRTNADRLIEQKRPGQSGGDNGQLLREIQYEINTSKNTIYSLNTLVCGGHRNPCDQICGGAGCGHCGRGMSCQDGSVYKASNARDLVNQARESANAKNNELERILSKVNYKRQQCTSVQELVQRLYREASQLHNSSSCSFIDVADFIAEVHSFLKDIATYPNHVRELARVVLNFRVEPTEHDIRKLSSNILTILGSLKNIDNIILATRDTLDEVNRLRHRAEKARNAAETVKERVQGASFILQNTSTTQRNVEASLETLKRKSDLIDEKIGKIGNLSSYGLSEFTKLVSYNVAGRINLMRQKIFKNEADVKKVLETVRSTEQLTNKIRELSNSIEKDHGEVVADLVVKSKEISELQDRVAVVRSKADMFRGRIAGWGSFMDDWKDKFSMRRMRLLKWSEDADRHSFDIMQLVGDIRRAEKYLRTCGTA